MYPPSALLAEDLRAHHQRTWQAIASPGDFFDAEDRLEMVRVSREAVTCALCQERKAALSPNAVHGSHDGPGNLSHVIVDLIHRLRTDPGRLTHSWFKTVVGQISQPAYVEIVSVVASAVIVDTLHNALGLGVPQLPGPQAGDPQGNYNPQAVDAGAWVPLLKGSSAMADTGLPQVPNIARALGLVPSALELFFNTFRPHYALKDIQLSISQAQAEYVAARVSAINECFY